MTFWTEWLIFCIYMLERHLTSNPKCFSQNINETQMKCLIWKKIYFRIQLLFLNAWNNIFKQSWYLHCAAASQSECNVLLNQLGVILHSFRVGDDCLDGHLHQGLHLFAGKERKPSTCITWVSAENLCDYFCECKRYNYFYDLSWPGILLGSLLGWRTQEQGAATRTDGRGSNKVNISESFFSDKLLKLGEKQIPKREPF